MTEAALNAKFKADWQQSLAEAEADLQSSKNNLEKAKSFRYVSDDLKQWGLEQVLFTIEMTRIRIIFINNQILKNS